MALKSLCTVVCLGMVVSACGGSAPPAPATEDEPEVSSVTHWTETTELFAEYPPLVAGETSRLAIHLTRLDSFAPVADGAVEVRLRGDEGDERFRTERPSQPGIFGVDVTPERPGPHDLVILLRAGDLEDAHHLGAVDVHADAEGARAGVPDEAEDPSAISFLKEQQWSLDFGTARVTEQAVRESIRVPAAIAPRPGGVADVVAPIDGRLTRVLDVLIGVGVSRGQELARVLPSPAVAGNLPELRRARDEARSALALAVRDRARAERVTAVGAAPRKRLDEARTAEEQAEARLSGAEASLAQYDATQTGGDPDAGGLFIIRAPVSGVIARREAATGATVRAGTALFRLVDTSQVHVVGQVPETESARAPGVTTAEAEVPGHDGRVPTGPLASVGRVLDPRSRTLPITFAFDNRSFGFPVGQAVFLHLLLDETAPRPVVPVAAVVDDAGRPVVFVQREGEAFERRPVTLGARTGDVVQVLAGLEAGDRVVTKGAYLVRLASLSTSAPAHGHVH